MIEVKLTFNSVAELVKFFDEHQMDRGAPVSDVPAPTAQAAPAENEKPKRKSKTKTEEPAAAASQATTEAAPANPLDAISAGAAPTADTFISGLLGGGAGSSAGALPPAVAQSQPVAAQAPQPAPAPQPAADAKPLDRNTVIKTFVQLSQTPGKGNPAVKAVLDKLGLATVGAIPEARYAEAVNLVKVALAA